MREGNVFTGMCLSQHALGCVSQHTLGQDVCGGGCMDRRVCEEGMCMETGGCVWTGCTLKRVVRIPLKCFILKLGIRWSFSFKKLSKVKSFVVYQYMMAISDQSNAASWSETTILIIFKTSGEISEIDSGIKIKIIRSRMITRAVAVRSIRFTTELPGLYSLVVVYLLILSTCIIWSMLWGLNKIFRRVHFNESRSAEILNFTFDGTAIQDSKPNYNYSFELITDSFELRNCAEVFNERHN